MNAHTTIQDAIASGQTTQTQIGRHLLAQIIDAAEYDRAVAIAAADVALELFAAPMPDAAPCWQSAQSEADWWADFASDTQIAAMLSACLKRIAEQGMIAPKARKRALVSIWNSLDPTERAAFLEFVDPGAAAKA